MKNYYQNVTADEYLVTYLKRFSDIQVNVGDKILDKYFVKTIDYTTAMKKINTKEFYGAFYIINNSTNHAIIFTERDAYNISVEDLKKILDNKNIYYQTIDDILNDPKITFQSIKPASIEWFDTYSYKYEYENEPRLFYNFYDKTENDLRDILRNTALYRIFWLYKSFIAQWPYFMPKKEQATDFLQQASVTHTYLDHVYLDDSSELPLYKEFFTNSEFKLSFNSDPQNYYRENVTDKYFRNKLSLYNDKKYGTFFNLDNISILKNNDETYDVYNKTYGKASAYTSFYLYYRNSNSTNNENDNILYTEHHLYRFAPKIVSNKLSNAQQRLLDKLKDSYPAIYKRVNNGIVEKHQKIDNLQLFSFVMLFDTSSTFTIRDIRESDLRLAAKQNLITKDFKNNIIERIFEVGFENWVNIGNSGYYLNKEAFKNTDNEYQFKLQKRITYYNSSFVLEIKLKNRRFSIPITETTFTDLVNIGAMDEEEKNLLYCEYLLKK